MYTAKSMSDTGLTLESLLTGLVPVDDVPGSALSVAISGLSMDSRAVKAGDLFFACFGRNHDARDYIDNAIEQGASAVLAHSGGQWQGCEQRVTSSGQRVPVICVVDLPALISAIAGRFFGEPGQRLVSIGVTGTNNKTSCTQFLAQALNALGERCGVIGTLGSGMYPSLDDSGYTTPDPIMAQQALAHFVSEGAGYAAIEASSQGLHQHRLAAVPFHAAMFTNLSRDHLDYHESMATYGEAKKKLFFAEGLKVAIINSDDAYASSILNDVSSRLHSLTYSLSDTRADVHARVIETLPNGYRATLSTPWGDTDLQGSLLGRFNISNVFAVLCALMTLPERNPPMTLATVTRILEALKPVSGRMEIVGAARGVSVVVDYAHTPDALKSALSALRDHYHGRIHCVFGCGGNRDKGKRPLMAEVAESLADFLVVTDDNPRMENADDIVKQILLGIEDRSRVVVQRDRAAAIREAILGADAGDVVLIAGKGHENYQDVGGQRMAFSDVAQTRLALQERDR